MATQTAEKTDRIDVESRHVESALARRDLRRYCEFASQGTWKTAPHLELLCELLMEAEQHVQEQHDAPLLIMVFMPPRHGKSEVISRYFPAWFLGRNPDKEVITTSYGADLALDMSRDARRIYRWSAEVFGWPKLAQESQAVSRWSVEGRAGKLQAAGVGGPITGRGAHVLLIDDPIKNVEDGESPIVQERNLDWYKTVARTRLAPGGCIVMLMTRWHVGDLAGRLLEEEKVGGEKWRVFRLPAIAEDGDPLGRGPGAALWPERFPIGALESIRSSLGYYFDALYQQSPRSEVKGALWDQAIIDQYRVRPEDVPKLETVLVSLDPSKSGKPGADECGVVVVGVGADGVVYILDDLSARVDPEVWLLGAVMAVQEWGTKANSCHPVAEDNIAGRMLMTSLNPIAFAAGVPNACLTERDLITAVASKWARAWPIRSRWGRGEFRMAGHFPKLEHEMTNWVDGVSWSPSRMDAMVHGLRKLSLYRRVVSVASVNL